MSVQVDKCCFCVRLSNFAIVLGCLGAFMSLTIVLVVGSFLLNYDILTTSFHQKGTFESVQLATFLQKYKNGKPMSPLTKQCCALQCACLFSLAVLLNFSFFFFSCDYNSHIIYRPPSRQLHKFTISCVRYYSCEFTL
jgi:hypothetical protein